MSVTFSFSFFFLRNGNGSALGLISFITISMHHQEMARDTLLQSEGIKPNGQHRNMIMWPIV